jgi:hypothetical protein
LIDTNFQILNASKNDKVQKNFLGKIGVEHASNQLIHQSGCKSSSQIKHLVLSFRTSTK